MTYATIADVTARMPEAELALLTDFDGVAGAVDTSVLQLALDDATAEINGYIAKVVGLPLANPPQMLMVVCRDLAVWRLYSNAGRITETQSRLRDGAIAYLKSVAAGQTSIGDDQGGSEVTTSPGAVLVEGPDRTMTRDTLKGF